MTWYPKLIRLCLSEALHGSSSHLHRSLIIQPHVIDTHSAVAIGTTKSGHWAIMDHPSSVYLFRPAASVLSTKSTESTALFCTHICLLYMQFVFFLTFFAMCSSMVDWCLHTNDVFKRNSNDCCFDGDSSDDPSSSSSCKANQRRYITTRVLIDCYCTHMPYGACWCCQGRPRMYWLASPIPRLGRANLSSSLSESSCCHLQELDWLTTSFFLSSFFFSSSAYKQRW